MMLRAIPTAQSPAEANKVLRDGWLQVGLDYTLKYISAVSIAQSKLQQSCSSPKSGWTFKYCFLKVNHSDVVVWRIENVEVAT